MEENKHNLEKISRIVYDQPLKSNEDVSYGLFINPFFNRRKNEKCLFPSF